MKMRSQDWREGEVMTEMEGCRPERKRPHVKVFTSYNNTTVVGILQFGFLCTFV